MSLDRANAFYQALETDAELLQAYEQRCSEIPDLPYLGEGHPARRHWSEAKILSFAAALGYHFELSDLYQAWFGGEDHLGQTDPPLGWKIKAITALNRQMAKPVIPGHSRFAMPHDLNAVALANDPVAAKKPR